ncbi:hypothetical protein CERZMDRAFT_104280 [Cercospora zeae-maydis SCOH1-5]|uniref:Ig-like domain-containing protein n=1 Tax=Cercospora zeae-maydis SCOH1-5 TaxID=717836 RepID=A0A6A6FWA2_9PEZI|nr:hypothetical protein CERZMDRAFT_104280 [Cercospora zeae-maydis SCOH1-5]
MQLITDLSLLASLASTVAATSSSPYPGCSTVSTTITTTVATITVTATPGASSPVGAATPSLSHSLFTSGSCSSSASTSASSSAAVWTSTAQAPPATTTTTTMPWALSTYTSSAKAGTTTTVTQCVAGGQQAGINTVPGANGTVYIVCAGAPYPTVSTRTGKSIADPVGATSTTRFSSYPTGPANSTSGPTATGTGSVHVTPTGIVPFTGGAASIGGKKALVALAAVAIGMLFV